jgi:hypothetical protein
LIFSRGDISANAALRNAFGDNGILEVIMDQDRFVEISHELARLLAHKTEFFRNAEHTPDELHAYAQSRERVRELFAELAELRGAVALSN